MNGPARQLSDAERRTQTRLDVRIPIKVTLPDREAPITAVNQDLSWGGARFMIGAQFVTEEYLTPKTGILRVSFPWKAGKIIEAEARVVRAQRLDNHRYMVAIRFESLAPESEEWLEALLDMLLHSGDADHGDADAAHLFRKLEITVADADRMRHLLEQIASGTLEVAVAEAYALNQSVRLVLTGTNGLPGTTLRARVIGADIQDKPDAPYRLRLRLEHPLDTIHTLADLLLAQLPAPAPPNPFAPDLPDWMREIEFARAITEHVDAEREGVMHLSALETHYLDELIYLARGWGDPEDFEYRFTELTMGERSVPGGWPMDAWEELGFLQDIHDDVYGLSEKRQSPLVAGKVR